MITWVRQVHPGHEFGWFVVLDGLRIASLSNCRLAEEVPWVEFDFEVIVEDPELSARMLIDDFWLTAPVVYVNRRLDLALPADYFIAGVNPRDPRVIAMRRNF